MLGNIFLKRQKNFKDFKYYAFISYSHKDDKWSKWLHSRIENYRTPRKLRGKEKNNFIIPKRLFPIFRDVEELPTSSNLGDNIINALKDSNYLIVIASPNSAKSIWVNEEIKIFKQLNKNNKILSLIVDGEPNVEGKRIDKDQECFSDYLKYKVDNNGKLIKNERIEPLAADVRKGNLNKKYAILKIIAGLLSEDYSLFVDREKRRRKRNFFSIATITFLIAITFLVYLFEKSKMLEERKQEEITQMWKEALDHKRSGDWVECLNKARYVFSESNDSILKKYSAKLITEYLEKVKLTHFQEFHSIGNIAFSNTDEQILVNSNVVEEVISIYTEDFTINHTYDYSFLDHIDSDFSYKTGLVSFLNEDSIIARPSSTIYLWDNSKGQLLKQINLGINISTYLDKFSKSKRYIFCICEFYENPKKLLTLTDLLCDEDGFLIYDKYQDFKDAAFSNDEKHLIIWNNWQTFFFSINDRTFKFHFYTPEIQTCCFSKDDSYIALQYRDSIEIYTFEFPLKKSATLYNIGVSVSHVEFLSNSLLCIVTTDGKIQIHNCKDKGYVVESLVHPKAVTEIVFNPDNNQLVTNCRDGIIRLWNMKTGVLQHSLLHNSEIIQFDIDNKTNRLFSCCNNGYIYVWNMETGRIIINLKHNNIVSGLKYIVRENTIITWGEDGYLKKWMLFDESIQSIEYGSQKPKILGATFSFDGKKLLTWTSDSCINVYSLFPELKCEESFLADGIIKSLQFLSDTLILVLKYDNIAFLVKNGTFNIDYALENTGDMLGIAHDIAEDQILIWNGDNIGTYWEPKRIRTQEVNLEIDIGMQIFNMYNHYGIDDPTLRDSLFHLSETGSLGFSPKIEKQYDEIRATDFHKENFISWYLINFHQYLDESEIISNEAGSEFLFASRNTLRKYEMSGLQEGPLAEFLDFNEAEIIQTGYTNLSNIFVLLNDQLYVFAARLDKPIIQENLDFKPDGIIFSSNDSLIFIWNTKQGRLIRNSNLNSYKDLQLQVRAEVNTGLRTFQNNSEAINFETWKMLRNKIGYKE